MKRGRVVLASVLSLALVGASLPAGLLAQALGPRDEGAVSGYMRQRIEQLSRQQAAIEAELQAMERGVATPGRIASPERAAYLRRLLQENNVLEARYRARLQGQSVPAGPANQGPTAAESLQGPPGDPVSGPAGRAGGGNPLEGLLGKQGGDMMTKMFGSSDPVDIGINIVSSILGFTLGKMAFGFIGGIAGAVLLPIVAKWLTKKVREYLARRNGGGGGTRQAGSYGQPAPPWGMPGKAQATGPAPAGSLNDLEAGTYRAYEAMMEAIEQGMLAEEVARRRAVWAQWKTAFENAKAAAYRSRYPERAPAR